MMKPTFFLSIFILGGVSSFLMAHPQDKIHSWILPQADKEPKMATLPVSNSSRQPASLPPPATPTPTKWSQLDRYFLSAERFFGSEEISHRRLVDYAIEVIPVHSALTAVHRAEIQGSLFMALRISYTDEEKDPIMRLSLELNGQRLDLVRGLEATRISTATGRPYTLFDLSTLPAPWSQQLGVILAAWPDGSDNRGDIKLLRANPLQWASVSLGSWINEPAPLDLAPGDTLVNASR